MGPVLPNTGSSSLVSDLLPSVLSFGQPMHIALFGGGALIAVLGAVVASRHRRSGRAGGPPQSTGTVELARSRPFDDAPVALLSFSQDGELLRRNREASRLLGIPEVRRDSPRTWAMLFGPESLTEASESLQTATRAELDVAWGAGRLRRWLRLTAAPAAEGIEVCIEDVTARRAEESELQFVAQHDPLTGLLNRRGFEARLEQAVAGARTGRSLAIAYLDLDRFKPVNDMFGHAAGDHVLREVAERLRTHVRQPHTLARMGGDEFVVLFVGIPLAEAHQLCVEALRAVHETPYRFQDKAFRVGGSIGLTPMNGCTIDEDVMVACDRACAEAKRDGGGRVIVVSDDTGARQERRDEQRLLEVLTEDASRQGLVTQMQPIVSLHHPTQSLGYEVLARLVDERGNTIPPSRFMDACERNGLNSRLDRRVLEGTLEWLDEHVSHREALEFAALNVGRASLNDECFVADVRSLLRAHPSAARRICFEIGEEAAISDPVSIGRFVEITRSYGARLVLDEFGARYTSFSHITHFRSDFVKIDAALIRDIDKNPASFSIVRSIVDVCHDLGTTCIAEWAHTEAVLRTLLELDVDYAQGNVLSRPLDRLMLLQAENCASFVTDPRISSMIAGGQSRTGRRTEPERQGPARH